MDNISRETDLDRFYRLLSELEETLDGTQRLKHCNGRMNWPDRGIYFFFSPGERRTTSDERRLTRIGTHAVSQGSSTTLWDRLKQHYGTGSRSANHPHGGNHRGSVYRLHVGEALIERHDLRDEYPDWGTASIPDERSRGSVRDEEYPLERRVSTIIRDQPFLWLEVDDEPSPDSDRAYIEQNSIALLSNFEKSAVGPRVDNWLGRDSASEEIRHTTAQSQRLNFSECCLYLRWTTIVTLRVDPVRHSFGFSPLYPRSSMILLASCTTGGFNRIKDFRSTQWIQNSRTFRSGKNNMPWGVNTEFTEEEGPEVEIDEDQEKVDRTEEGSETTQDFDIDEAISNLDCPR